MIVVCVGDDRKVYGLGGAEGEAEWPRYEARIEGGKRVSLKRCEGVPIEDVGPFFTLT